MNMSLSLCKLCMYYNHRDKTCKYPTVAEKAKTVRLDHTKCGPLGKWYKSPFGNDGLSRTLRGSVGPFVK